MGEFVGLYVEFYGEAANAAETAEKFKQNN